MNRLRLLSILSILAKMRSYVEVHEGEALLPSKKNPEVRRWQKEEPVTNIPRSSRQWGAGETENGTRFKDFFSNITNTQGFGQHIDTSIPGFREHRGAQAIAAASLTSAPTVLDVGASEGQWGAAIQRVNPAATVIDLDPNPDMLRNNINPHSKKVLGAWVEGFNDGERDIPAYQSNEKADVVGMHMVRQFVTRDGDTWYGEVKKHMKPDGVFMYSCKCIASPGQEEDWKNREAEKDAFKRRTYTQEEMDTKADEVLVGMHHLMMPHEEEMASLGRHFKHVVPVWHSANFRGYFCGDNHETVQRVAATYHSAKSE